LTFLPGQLPVVDSGGSSFVSQGALVGNGRAGLWYVRTRATREGIEIYKLDENGDPVDSTLIEPPDLPSLARERSEQATIEGYATILNDEGPAPILSLSWSKPCEGSDSCDYPHAYETVALAEELHDRPLRLAHAMEAVPFQAARSADGGLWLFSDSLRKYDARGSLEIRQTLLERAAWPAPTVRGGSGTAFRSEALIALEGALSPQVYAFGEAGFPELWLLDARGNVEHRYSTTHMWGDADFGDTGDAVLAVDERQRTVAFVETSRGDLLVVRLDAAREKSEMRQLMREDFRSLAPISVSEDSAGNLYVISAGGARNAPLPMLCKLPLAGAMRCYTVPELAVDDRVTVDLRLIGGPEDVVYVYYLANVRDIPNTRETLARFELP
jgi:hypothetical protein